MRSRRPRKNRSAENIGAMAEDVAERRATLLGINRQSLRRILLKDLKVSPDKVDSASAASRSGKRG